MKVINQYAWGWGGEVGLVKVALDYTDNVPKVALKTMPFP